MVEYNNVEMFCDVSKDTSRCVLGGILVLEGGRKAENRAPG